MFLPIACPRHPSNWLSLTLHCPCLTGNKRIFAYHCVSVKWNKNSFTKRKGKNGETGETLSCHSWASDKAAWGVWGLQSVKPGNAASNKTYSSTHYTDDNWIHYLLFYFGILQFSRRILGQLGERSYWWTRLPAYLGSKWWAGHIHAQGIRTGAEALQCPQTPKMGLRNATRRWEFHKNSSCSKKQTVNVLTLCLCEMTIPF